MPQNQFTDSISTIRTEVLNSFFQEGLLDFSTRTPFKSKLLPKNGIIFWKAFLQQKELPLSFFFPKTDTFTEQHQKKAIALFCKTIQEKNEDFGIQDLFLSIGFIKCSKTRLAPALLIPLTLNLQKQTLKISTLFPPIENISLQANNSDVILPKAADYGKNDKFDIDSYFAQLEKIILTKTHWKFTRQGLCLSFFSSEHIYLYKALGTSIFTQEKELRKHPLLFPLLNTNGFRVQEFQFEDKPLDQIFNPADHAFIYPQNSNATKTILEALDNKNKAFAIQVPPGTSLFKTTANIVAETIAKGKRVLVLTRRTVTKEGFFKAWKPSFRPLNNQGQKALETDFRKKRSSLLSYYKTVNTPAFPGGISLANILKAMTHRKSPSNKIPVKYLKGIEGLGQEKFNEIQKILCQIQHFLKATNGAEIYELARTSLLKECTSVQKEILNGQLSDIRKTLSTFAPFAKALDEIQIFPESLTLEQVSDAYHIIKKHFKAKTLSFEGWNLQSESWNIYRAHLEKLPKSGSLWSEFRRQTSEIYNSNAISENLLKSRTDLASTKDTAFRALSDRYNKAKKHLQSVLQTPKKFDNDKKLLEVIDNLLKVQESRLFYRSWSALGSHLLGKDWKYEQTNWAELDKKIQFVYNLREMTRLDKKVQLIWKLLEKYHLLRESFEQIEDFEKNSKIYQEESAKFSEQLKLKPALDQISIAKHQELLDRWAAQIPKLDQIFEINRLFNILEKQNLAEIGQFLLDGTYSREEIREALTTHWLRTQFNQIQKESEENFVPDSQKYFQKSKQYRKAYEAFLDGNYTQIQAQELQTPRLRVSDICQSFLLSEKESFDLVLFLDSELISLAETLPAIQHSKQVIAIGDTEFPGIEKSFMDGFEPIKRHLDVSGSYQENFLTYALRKGISTHILSLAEGYKHPALYSFSNHEFYSDIIQQFPAPFDNPCNGFHLQISEQPLEELIKAILDHIQKKPDQTLGVIANTAERCLEIEAALAHSKVNIAAFKNKTTLTNFYIKTPDRAAGKYRDSLFILAEQNTALSRFSGSKKINVCATHAKQELHIFLTPAYAKLKDSNNPGLQTFRNWLTYIQSQKDEKIITGHSFTSSLLSDVANVLGKNKIQVQKSYGTKTLNIGLAVQDVNNPRHFLAAIESDTEDSKQRCSLEDCEYIRPTLLKRLGWKLLQIWTPSWYLSTEDETTHLLTTIAMEQSLAPLPQDNETNASEKEEQPANSNIVPYPIVHPVISPENKGKSYIDVSSYTLMGQLNFYIEHETPIHRDCLKKRLQTLYKVSKDSPLFETLFKNALAQGLKAGLFIKTGNFFYSKHLKAISLRYRGNMCPFERKLIYVSPEERALLPASIDNAKIKQMLGLLE